MANLVVSKTSVDFNHQASLRALEAYDPAFETLWVTGVGKDRAVTVFDLFSVSGFLSYLFLRICGLFDDFCSFGDDDIESSTNEFERAKKEALFHKIEEISSKAEVEAVGRLLEKGLFKNVAPLGEISQSMTEREEFLNVRSEELKQKDAQLQARLREGVHERLNGADKRAELMTLSTGISQSWVASGLLFQEARERLGTLIEAVDAEKIKLANLKNDERLQELYRKLDQFNETKAERIVELMNEMVTTGRQNPELQGLIEEKRALMQAIEMRNHQLSEIKSKWEALEGAESYLEHHLTFEEQCSQLMRIAQQFDKCEYAFEQKKQAFATEMEKLTALNKRENESGDLDEPLRKLERQMIDEERRGYLENMARLVDEMEDLECKISALSGKQKAFQKLMEDSLRKIKEIEDKKSPEQRKKDDVYFQVLVTTREQMAHLVRNYHTIKDERNRVRQELQALKASMPEIEEIEGHIEGVRKEFVQSEIARGSLANLNKGFREATNLRQ